MVACNNVVFVIRPYVIGELPAPLYTYLAIFSTNIYTAWMHHAHARYDCDIGRYFSWRAGTTLPCLFRLVGFDDLVRLSCSPQLAQYLPPPRHSLQSLHIPRADPHSTHQVTHTLPIACD